MVQILIKIKRVNEKSRIYLNKSTINVLKSINREDAIYVIFIILN